MTEPINKAPYLRTSREFPEDSAQALSVQINKAYLDIANKVNDRTIGLFPTNVTAVTGEAWFLKGPNQKQQGLRQIYPFTSAALTFPHNINIGQISGFIRIWGTFVDSGGVWYPLPYVDAVAASNQVAIKVDATNIVITKGAGAPAPVSGTVVLEWLANP